MSIEEIEKLKKEYSNVGVYQDEDWEIIICYNK